MEYDKTHGIQWRNGAAITVAGCPCGGCSNIVLAVVDEAGTKIKMDLSRCEYGHLLGELLAFAEKIAGPAGACPQVADGSQLFEEQGIVPPPKEGRGE
jgi:hypothetical protein